MEFVKGIFDNNLCDLLSLHNEPPVQDLMAMLKQDKELQTHFQKNLIKLLCDGQLEVR